MSDRFMTLPNLTRRDLLPMITAFALVILGWLALSSTGDKNEQLRRMELEKIHQDLVQQISGWESRLQSHLDDAVRQIDATPSDFAKVQARLHERSRWVDSVYVWEMSPAARLEQPAVPRYLHPLVEPMRTWTGACAADLVASPPGPPVERVVSQFQAACAEQPMPERVIAAETLARQLAHDGRSEAALGVMQAVPFSGDATLAATSRHGVPIADAISRRLLIGELMLAQGQTDAGRARIATVVNDAASLDAPALESSLYAIQATLDALAPAGLDTKRLTSLLRPAEQRLAAWRQVQSLAQRPPSQYASEAPRFVADPFGDSPWLLYARAPSDRTRGVAIQLLQTRMIEDFLRSVQGPLKGHVVIKDPTGRVVGGDAAVAEEPNTVVRFSIALGHLRVGVDRAHIERRVQPMLTRWSSGANLLTAFCIILGFGALAMFVAADRQHQELLRRQKEFATRVTHELKTPLAGIKVMAENIGSGAFKDAAQRGAMADRIIAEADRLTARVNEILQVTRKPELPTIAPFDLEEVLLEVIDEWGPRYEQLGIQLSADMDAMDPLTGDARAIRDAVACLLDNALKYRREDVDSEVQLNARQDGRHVEIEVMDNGMGVPADQRKRIFERFVRIEGDNRGLAGGHGLGLAQVSEIVRAHGGTAWCDDGLDGGARFVIRLPLAA
jgi:signal transduction histidine kinase